MLNHLLKNRFFIAFNQMSSAGLIVQLLALALSPILSRIYSSEEFGRFGLFISITSLISIFASFKLETAYFIKKEYVEYFLVFSIVGTLIISLISSFIVHYWFAVSISLFALLLGILGTSIFQIYGQLIIAQGKYKSQSISRILQGFFQYSFVLLLGGIYSSGGLIISYIIGQIIGIIYLMPFLKFTISELNKKKGALILHQNYPFCINSTISSALQWSVPLAPMFIGKGIYGIEIIGIYFLISQSIQAPVAILRRSLLNIITSELNTVKTFNDVFKPFVFSYLKKIVILVFGVIFLLFIITYFYGEQIIVFIFGEQWKEGGAFLCYMIVYYIFDLFLQPFSNLLNLWGYYRCVYLIQGTLFFCIYSLLLIVKYLSISFVSYLCLHYLFIICAYLFTISFIFYYSGLYAEKKNSNLK